MPKEIKQPVISNNSSHKEACLLLITLLFDITAQCTVNMQYILQNIKSFHRGVEQFCKYLNTIWCLSTLAAIQQAVLNIPSLRLRSSGHVWTVTRLTDQSGNQYTYGMHHTSTTRLTIKQHQMVEYFAEILNFKLSSKPIIN